MKMACFTLLLSATALVSASSHARSHCRRNAISAAKLSTPGYHKLFDIRPLDETPDLITYEVELADVLPEPNVTSTVEVTLAKLTCAIVTDPVHK